jgi:hypothetical protein
MDRNPSEFESAPPSTGPTAMLKFRTRYQFSQSIVSVIMTNKYGARRSSHTRLIKTDVRPPLGWLSDVLYHAISYIPLA